MSNIGMCKIKIAPLDTSAGTYSNGMSVGKAISCDINPNYSESKLYADDALAEYEKSFTDADVTLNTSTLPLAAANKMFGHTVDANDKNTIFNQADESNYVGQTFISTKKDDGVVSYEGMFLPKVKYSEAANSFTTKGESTEFKTPTINGKALADSTGKWKETQEFATLALAEAWCDSKLNISNTP